MSEQQEHEREGGEGQPPALPGSYDEVSLALHPLRTFLRYLAGSEWMLSNEPCPEPSDIAEIGVILLKEVDKEIADRLLAR